ncbi:MAG TPA: nuclear transport factor 2 family protein [Pyrinomonadaceae bacterium]|nr:nuclear transport factor 2 family protein [Pyrinomonadaceae bacterium]
MSRQSGTELTRAETENLLLQLNDEWMKALVRHDVAVLNEIMADDFLWAYPFEGDDRDQFVGDVISGDVKVEYLSRENLSVRIWRDTAIVVGTDSAKWYYQGHDYSGHYKVLNVYARRDGKWQLVCIQACPIS